MHRFCLGLRVVVPVGCPRLGGSLGLEVLGTGICVSAQQVSKSDPTNPLSTLGLHDMDYTYSPAGLPACQPRMPFALPLQDETSFDQAVADAWDVARRHGDQNVDDILGR